MPRGVSRCCARAHRTGWRAPARAAAFVSRVADCGFFRTRCHVIALHSAKSCAVSEDLIHQFDQAGIANEMFHERFIQCGQTQSMLAGERHHVTVSDLIRAGHQVRSDDAVGATQIVRHKLMAWVGHQAAEHAKGVIGRHAVAQQWMRGDAGKSELRYGAGGKGGDVFEP